MQQELLYTTALDANGNLVNVDIAQKGNQYFCPTCKNKFILRKSGRTGKGSKRAHFAHNNLTPNCTPEGVLHFSFKKLLIGLLNRYNLENKVLNVNWKCNKCFVDYSQVSIQRNLLRKVASIEEEYDLKVCRPDIALLNNEGKIIGVIEIVVTHEPEDNAIQYYRENGITLIQINLTSNEDLLKVEERISNPDVVNYCINPKCSNLSNHSVNRNLRIGIVNCKSCRQRVKIFQLNEESIFGKLATRILTENELKIVEAKGVLLEVKYDKRLGVKYHIVKCQSCELRKKQMRSKYNRRRRL